MRGGNSFDVEAAGGGAGVTLAAGGRLRFAGGWPYMPCACAVAAKGSPVGSRKDANNGATVATTIVRIGKDMGLIIGKSSKA